MASKTNLVSIVGKQTIPNILLIKEFERKINKFIFITTNGSEEKNKTDDTIKASGINNNYIKINVPEDNIKKIEKILESNDFSDNERYIINLTGGTKMMAIAIYNFFSKWDSEIYYIPIGKNLYRRLHLSLNIEKMS